MAEGRVIWIVEDSPVEAEMIRRMLSDSYQVEVFSEAPPMLERFSGGERPAALVLDLQLPGVGGLEACRLIRLRADRRQLPVLMLTMRSSRDQVQEGLEAGANDYLFKPVEGSELRARLEEVLRTRALEDQLASVVAQGELDRQQLATVLAHAPSGICALQGKEQICTFANPEFRRFFGVGAEVVGKPIRQVLPVLEQQGFFAPIDQVLATGETFVAQSARLGLSGDSEPVFLKTTYTASRNALGEVVGVHLFTFDLTVQVTAKRKVEELLSLASHELRTPLTSLQLQLQLFERELAKDEGTVSPHKLRTGLERIGRQVRRQVRLVDSLLNVSRVAEDRLQLEWEELDMVALAEEVVSRFEEDARAAGSTLKLETQGPLPVTMDRLRIEQVLTNLISNAIKYGRGSEIQVSVQAVGRRNFRLSVKDRGIGIGPLDVERVFDRFGRAVSERHYGGFGLGLWITRRVVDALRGTISVESELGRGSTFTVELPRAPVTEGSPS